MLPFSNELFTRNLFTVPSLLPLRLPCSRETHFWYVVLDEVNNAPLLNEYLNILSPCERQTVLCINGTKQQKCALLSHALVRTTLSRYMQCKVMPRSLSFSKNRYGKPQLVWQHEEGWIPPRLHFNLSHTSSLVACGVTIDLQEAYVKALGRGFSAAPFRNFTLRYEARDCNRVLEPRVAVEVHSDSEHLTENWKFAMVDLTTHYGAICVEKTGDKDGERNGSLMLKVWKTIPFVEDERIF